MRPLAMTLLALLLVPATGCSDRAPIGNPSRDIRVEADDAGDFSRYRTYAFLPGQLSADPALVNVGGEELDRRVAAALQPRLAGKGLQLAGAGEQPDLYVTYIAAVRQEDDIVRAGGGQSRVGGYDEPGAVAPGAEWGVRARRVGSLLLQFTDARTRAAVWQATVNADVFEEGRALDRALDAALKRYPPRK